MGVPLLNPRPRAPRGKTPPTGEDTDPDKPNKVSLKIFVDIEIPDRFQQNRSQISKTSTN